MICNIVLVPCGVTIAFSRFRLAIQLQVYNTTYITEKGRLRFGEKLLPDHGHVAIISHQRHRRRNGFNLRLRAHLIKTANGGPLE